ncbi:gliding motility protein GldB-related protein [Chitinophaga vietnamensis]|uniref:gliding motility protein GldB-related protein n=1 Tax=Chitinophaga vietnamensis TaxID=2593957 RepID=UPI001177EB9A|nr:hypothetical protein [Chitinophaga vietnamensis]
MKRLFCLLLCLPLITAAQQRQKVFTEDIDRFWQAYDSVRTTKDSLRQLYFIQTLYVDKGTPGLHAFMAARDYSAPLWVSLINRLPKFWESIRQNTLTAKSRSAEIEQSLARLKKLYPELRNAAMYFTIGGLRSGGTVRDSMVLIGAEIATGTAAVDVSEFPTKWLANVFKSQELDNIVPLNIHEYVHTQQQGEPGNLLATAIHEGACEFVTELVMEKPLQGIHIRYGNAHEAELKARFKEEMFSDAAYRWMYDGSDTADLGYFMGYAICKAYYHRAASKTQAVKDIIRLNYSDNNAVEHFLQQSGYYAGKLDKAASMRHFDAQVPQVISISPLGKDSTMAAGVSTMQIVFSKEMREGSHSFSLSNRGKEYYPPFTVKGLAADKKTFVLEMKLEAGKEYEFLITGNSFRSADGYRLRPYLVRFRTK